MAVVGSGGRAANIPGTPGRIPNTPANVPPAGALPSPPGSGKGDLRGGPGPITMSWAGWMPLSELPDRVRGDMQRATDAALAQMASDMVEWAKQNAPWQDRTGDARKLLNSPGVVTHPDGSKALIIRHGVDYGVYLETMDGGALGILARTVEHFRAELGGRIRVEVGK